MTAAADLSRARIVIVNWRDPWHPQAGGAERYAWEMARGLAARGATVRFAAARVPGRSRTELRDGIRILRLGGRFTVYPWVLAWLFVRRQSVDIVLDCQNGIPFFAPLVLPRRIPVLCVMHHVHDAQFGLHFPGWLARIGRFLEGPVAKAVYRRHACVAVSPSTITAMRQRLGWTGDIYLIPNGAPAVSPTAVSPTAVSPTVGSPTAGDVPAGPGALVWVGRLVAHKRAELVLPVAGRGFTIDVIGRGPAAPALRAAVAARGLEQAVRVRGFLPEAAREALVARSLLHLNTSQGEGWGLCVLEAAALGVPTVAYDVDGLRDAVRDGETGWLVRAHESFPDVVERAVRELADPARRRQVAAACRDWAGQLGWESSTARMAELVTACLRAGSARARRPGAWIVSRAGEGRPVAEGPVLDQLIAAGGVPIRPASVAERLLGAAADNAPAGSARPR